MSAFQREQVFFFAASNNETTWGYVHGERANVSGLVLGCIEADQLVILSNQWGCSPGRTRTSSAEIGQRGGFSPNCALTCQNPKDRIIDAVAQGGGTLSVDCECVRPHAFSDDWLFIHGGRSKAVIVAQRQDMTHVAGAVRSTCCLGEEPKALYYSPGTGSMDLCFRPERRIELN